MHKSTRLLEMVLAAGLAAFVLAGCSAESKKSRHLARADRFVASGQYDDAEIEFIKVLRLEPLNPHAIRSLGLLYFEQGRILRAYSFLNKAKELASTNLDVHVKLGACHLVAGDLKAARDEAVYVLDRNPGNEDALMILVDAADKPGEIEAVRQRLQAQRQRAGDSAALQLALGMLHWRQGDAQSGEAAFKRAQALDPKSSLVQLALGNFYVSRNDPKQAEAAFKTAAALGPARSNRPLRYAEFKLQLGEMEEARKPLQETIKQAPDYLPALRLLARITVAERKFDESASWVQRILAREPIDFDGLLISSRVKLGQGRPDAAVKQLERLAEAYPKMPVAHYELALGQLANDELAKAVNSLDQALALAPDYADALLLLADLNTRRGEARTAMSSLTRFISKLTQAMQKESQTNRAHFPQLMRAQLLMANACLAQGKSEEAVAVYGLWAGQAPEDPRPHFLAGLVRRGQNKPEEARKAFEKALNLAPDDPRIIEQLVALDVRENQFAAATQRVLQALQKQPKSLGLKLLQAHIYMAQTNTAQAEAALLKVIQEEPNAQLAYLMLARNDIAAGKDAAALEQLQTVVAKNPKNITALMQIGMLQQQLPGNYRAAGEAYEKLLAINPRFVPAINNLAYLYSEHLGKLDRAHELAKRARALEPENASAADTFGWILFKRGEYPQALTVIREGAEKLPANAEILYHLGMAHYMVGEEDPARVALQRALQLGENFPGKPEAEKRLALLNTDPQAAPASRIAALKKRLAEVPDDPIALVRLAGLYEQTGAPQDARNTYTQALKQNPRSVPIMIRLMRLYAERLHDATNAMALARSARSLAPDDPVIASTLGRLACQSGDYKWGLSLLRESARKLPDQPELLYDLAVASYNVGQVAEAETAMKRALQLDSLFPHADAAKRFLAMVNLGSNPAQLALAAAQVQQALDKDPGFTPALLAAGLLHERRGDLAAARRTYEAMLARTPLFTPAIRQLALLGAQNPADDKRAYERATKAREAYPQDAEVAKALGLLTYHRKEYSRAVQLLKESAVKRTTDAELFYYLGLAQHQLKQTKETADALRKALSLNLGGPMAEEARRILQPPK